MGRILGNGIESSHSVLKFGMSNDIELFMSTTYDRIQPGITCTQDSETTNSALE